MSAEIEGTVALTDVIETVSGDDLIGCVFGNVFSIRFGVGLIEARFSSWSAMADRLGGVHDVALPLLLLRRCPGPFFRRCKVLILDVSGLFTAAGPAGDDV